MARKAKICIYDIEVLSSMAADCGSICCMSYKDYGSKKVHTISIDDYPKTYEKNVFDDSKIVLDIKKILEGYDILIGHNSKSTVKWGFDLKYINTRLILQHPGVSPVRCIAEVDTLNDMAKKHLRFRSNKLSELAKKLELPEDLIDDKDDMQFPDDWNRVIIKAPGAMSKMKRRSKVDVLLTEGVYDRLKLIHTAHPNVGLLQGQDKSLYPCALCGCTDKVNNKDKHEYVYATARTLRQRLICRRCNFTFPGPPIVR